MWLSRVRGRRGPRRAQRSGLVPRDAPRPESSGPWPTARARGAAARERPVEYRRRAPPRSARIRSRGAVPARRPWPERGGRRPGARWSRDEAAMVTEDLRAFLAANQYETVVAHLAAEAPIVKAAAPDAIPTSKERPTSDESLASLTQTLNHATASAPRVPKGRRFSEEMSNVARFQFGEAGLGLVRGASFPGRMPDVRLIREGTQVAMHTGRGMLALTLRGGAILSQADAYWVEIEDFLPKGNIFAVGVVDAAPEIRPGDEVVVRHQKDVRAVGTARLSGREMVDFRRGEAVHVRHVIEMPP